MTESFRTHTYAAAARSNPPGTRAAAPITVLARRLADDDVHRIQIVDPTAVVVHNSRASARRNAPRKRKQ